MGNTRHLTHHPSVVTVLSWHVSLSCPLLAGDTGWPVALWLKLEFSIWPFNLVPSATFPSLSGFTLYPCCTPLPLRFINPCFIHSSPACLPFWAMYMAYRWQWFFSTLKFLSIFKWGTLPSLCLPSPLNFIVYLSWTERLPSRDFSLSQSICQEYSLIPLSLFLPSGLSVSTTPSRQMHPPRKPHPMFPEQQTLPL